MARTASDDELLARAREGDQRAFQEIVERYEDLVAATVIGMMGPGSEADDVGQETFIRFYGSLDRFRGESALGTYLTRIAINQSLKALKKRRSLKERFLQHEDDDAYFEEPAADMRERAELVQEAVLHLKPDLRAVVVLRMFQGYSTRETAEQLGLPEGTVMSRLSRALERLERRLKHLL